MSSTGALALSLFVASAWYIRFSYDRTGTTNEFKWFIAFIAWHWKHLPLFFAKLLFDGLFRQGWISVVLLSTNVCSTVSYILSYQTYLLTRQQNEWAQKRQERLSMPPGTNPPSGPLKPLLFPCRTSHTRMFPKKHSFSYSYLFVGIPIGWRGSVGDVLSADLESLPWRGRKPKTAWFSVESADHLSRGDNVNGLQGKLDAYLESEVGDTYCNHPPLALIFSTERKSRGLCPCISHHCTSFLRLCFQSCFLLVSIQRV